MKSISRNVWLLSCISLFTDAASEMLYPVMPVYLKSIGYSIVLIGILEGVAEAVAGLTKGYFGALSDVHNSRVPFVKTGYALSALSKPLTALFTLPVWIFFVRTIDRLGKGIRTGARDALLSQEATPAAKGKIFGFHRSMDTLGAALGPALALVFLWYQPAQYKTIFLLALIPGILAIATSFLLKEKKKIAPTANKHWPGFTSFLTFWKPSTQGYKRLVVGLLLLALINSSDVFLLLKIKEAGFSDVQVISLYIFYNLIFALAAFPLGILADKIGLRTMFITGLILYAIVYIGFSWAHTTMAFLILLFLYGCYAAATEGISKAWITNLVNKNETATAIGFYTSFQSIAALLASTLAGLVWQQYNAEAMFLVTGIAATVLISYFIIFVPRVSER